MVEKENISNFQESEMLLLNSAAERKGSDSGN
jgi:hypothetical protein